MTKLAEQLKQGADQAWESLSEGWREPNARASGAPTRLDKELIMSSRFGSSLSKNAGRTHRKNRRRGGLPSMSESQTRAYLAARDVLRRIHRLASQHGAESGETDTRRRSSPTRTQNPSVEGGIEPMGERA